MFGLYCYHAERLLKMAFPASTKAIALNFILTFKLETAMATTKGASAIFDDRINVLREEIKQTFLVLDKEGGNIVSRKRQARTGGPG